MTIEKKELVNLFYILDKMNIGDLTANHASIYSKKKKGFYINKHQYLFSQINIKNLSFIKLKEQFQKNIKRLIKQVFLFINTFIHPKQNQMQFYILILLIVLLSLL